MNDGSVQELVEALVGPVRYREDDLERGLQHEKARLGTKPYLVALWRSEFDQDGLTDWLVLLDSFSTLDEAKEAADAEVRSRIERYTDPSNPINPYYSGPWRYWPSRDSRPEYLPKPLVSSGASEQYRKTFALKGGELESMYCSLYVLGPFTGAVVGQELLELFKESRHELWACFLEVGEQVRVAKE